MQTKPLRQIRLTDQIVDHIRTHIATTDLKPGDRLPSESELARELGVGRPTVREAINALAGSGLVRVTTGKAPVVGTVTGEPVSKLVSHGMAIGQISPLHTLEFRRFLEERAARLAAQHRTDAHAAALETILAELAAGMGDLERFSTADVEFHKVLASASGNPLVEIVIDGIADATLQSSRTGLRYVLDEAEWTETYKVHERVALAVIAMRPEAAEKAMRDHFDEASERIRRGAAL
ncbi:FadR/GntR family transcriptional regulator [Arvimicrobium flavum]|uniref:FadR/GntR family transcriptional regulator n=1 Tax=Arvimicrobium flavum TaxID=3393320 RepID=UPI00237B9691|nr:FadR/GntR family transcriptional regulator [Mesorhizobium shangrilense]